MRFMFQRLAGASSGTSPGKQAGVRSREIPSQGAMTSFPTLISSAPQQQPTVLCSLAFSALMLNLHAGIYEMRVALPCLAPPLRLLFLRNIARSTCMRQRIHACMS